MTVWLQITSGRGPAECEWVVARLLRELEEEARAAGLTAELLETVAGQERDTLASALLAVEGPDSAAFAAAWTGTVQWIGASPFRPHHKRRNWFAGVTLLQPPERPDWSERDLVIETTRASGPGGQHVNKTESAVRITHRPTGTVAVAQEERSQHRNRALALARLAEKLAARGQQAEDHARKERWDQHNQLERGNARRVYAGLEFRQHG